MTLNDYLGKHGPSSRRFERVNGLVKSGLTTLMMPRERRKARALVSSSDAMKLHLGCGDTYLKGWVNIDLSRPGRLVDLRWDLRNGLPFPEESTQVVFSEHLFEHIPLRGAIALATESYRVLKPNGIFRVAVPDLGRYLRSYCEQDSLIDIYRPDRPTPSLAINEIFYLHGHATMYDWSLMRLLLEEVGFSKVVRSSFGHGEVTPNVDSRNREAESLYVEAIKGSG